MRKNGAVRLPVGALRRLGKAARALKSTPVMESERRKALNGPAREHWVTGEAVSLPSLSGLSEDDEVFLRAMLAFAETGAMFRGRYVEAHVARLLGTVFPSTGVSGWDLMVPGDRPVFVEVKASRSSGFTYAVAGPGDRTQFRGRKRMTVSKVFEKLEPVDADGLLAEVRRRADG